MLDASAAVAHHEERVAGVRQIAHERGRRLDHLLQIGEHPRAIDAGRDVLNRHGMPLALHVESERLLVADQHRAVVERVEVRRGERVRSAPNRIEPGGDPGPSRRQLDAHRGGALKLSLEIHEHPCRGDEGSMLVQVVLRGESHRPQNVVAQHHGGRPARRNAPRVLRDLLPGQRSGPARPARGSPTRSSRSRSCGSSRDARPAS